MRTIVGAAIGGGAGLLVPLLVFLVLGPFLGIGVVALGFACGILCAGLFWLVALWTPGSASEAK